MIGLLLAVLVTTGPEVAGPPPEQPSLELLEFLGSFEDGQGQWLDPLTLEDRPVPEERPTDRKDHENEDDTTAEQPAAEHDDRG